MVALHSTVQSHPALLTQFILLMQALYKFLLYCVFSHRNIVSCKKDHNCDYERVSTGPTLDLHRSQVLLTPTHHDFTRWMRQTHSRQWSAETVPRWRTVQTWTMLTAIRERLYQEMHKAADTAYIHEELRNIGWSRRMLQFHVPVGQTSLSANHRTHQTTCSLQTHTSLVSKHLTRTMQCMPKRVTEVTVTKMRSVSLKFSTKSNISIKQLFKVLSVIVNARSQLSAPLIDSLVDDAVL